MKKVVFMVLAAVVGSFSMSSRTAPQSTLYNFRVGDDVKRSSGGPLMTVERILQNGKVMCNYMSRRDNTFTIGVFDISELEKVEIEAPLAYELDLAEAGSSNQFSSEREG